MDELLDILDANGHYTGKTAMKSVAHKNGWFHPTVHIWFYTTDGKVLLQQRGKNKDTHPLLWDVSVAGHIGAGETPELGAVREIKEEIGLTVSPADLEKIGVFKYVQKHNDNLIDCEYHHTFLAELKVPLKSLKKQESEVDALALVSLRKFAEETWGMANLQNYVPYEPSYYQTIVSHIQKKE